MPHSASSRRPAPAPLCVLDAVLVHWLALGALMLLIVPVSDWHNPWIGWLPFWGVLAPLLPLMVRMVRKRLSAHAGTER